MPEEDVMQTDIYLEETAKAWFDIQKQWLTHYPHIYYLVDHEGVLFPFGIHSQLDQLEEVRLKHRVHHMPVNNDMIRLLRRLKKDQADDVSLVTASLIDTKHVDFVTGLNGSYDLLQDRSHRILRSIDPQMQYLYGLMEANSLLVFINDSERSAIPYLADYLIKHNGQECDTWGVIQMHVPKFSTENNASYSQGLYPVIQGLREKKAVSIRSLI